MPEKTWIKAALLTAAAIGLTAPALAQPSERGERGRGERMSQGRTDAPRGDFRTRGDDSRARPAPGISRTAPAPAPAPAPRAEPPQRAAPPVTAAPAAPTQRAREPRPGTREWYQQRGIDAPRAQPDPATAQPRSSTRMERERPDDRNRPNWRDNQSRDNDRRGNDGRNWNDRDGRDWNGRDRDGRDWNRERNWNDNRWNRNDWRYVPGPRVQNRWDGFDRWDNGWRRDRRYDWQQWRRYNRDVFHLPHYRAPFGWTRGYSRFSIGIYLDNILFSTSYWIDDPYRFRLPPAYGPFRWIRYYDDALLVDLRDGYVVDVVYDVFW